MTLVALPGQGIMYPSYNSWEWSNANSAGQFGINVHTIDATNEAIHFVGHWWLEDGPGSSKTFGGGSTALGYFHNSSTFSTAGSTIEVGIQDVLTTSAAGTGGRGDGTFDVSKNLVQGTHTFPATNTWQELTSFTGTKTINHGDAGAVVFKFTTRNGADALNIGGLACDNTTAIWPVTTFESAAGAFSAGLAGSKPLFVAKFSDGTRGVFMGTYPLSAIGASLIEQFNTGSNPDERGLLFQVPFACKISGVWAVVGGISSNYSNDYNIILYDDPLGTAAANTTYSVDASAVVHSGLTAGTNMAVVTFPLTSAVELTKDTDYALIIKPTSANNASLNVINVNESGDRILMPGGMSTRFCDRVDAATAFTERLTKVAVMGVYISHLSDNTGGGGGGSGYVRPVGCGGMVL